MQLREGVFRLQIPTCLPVGDVNVYLFKGEQWSIVDTGPKTPDTYESLVRQLKGLDLAVGDIGRILVTHGHVDHHGLSEVIRRESDAKVIVPEKDVEMVADFSDAYRKRREIYRDSFLRTGIPDKTLELIEDYFNYLSSLAEATPVSQVIKDGDPLDMGVCKLTAIHTPGHSPGSTCFFDKTEKCLISGDTLLKDIVPISAFGSSDGKSVGLSDYLSSIEKIERLEVLNIYPGHKGDFKDLQAYSALIHSQIESRRANILNILRKEENTVCDLTTNIFGPLPIQDIFLGLTEILGHLEMLMKEKLIRCEEKDGVDHYSKV